MTITVLSLVEAERDAKSYDAVISLLDSDWRGHFEPFHANQKIWFFDDVDKERPDCVAPKENDIKQIIEFFKLNQDKKVLVHCYAGISRSTATAIGLKIYNGIDTEKAYEETYAQRPIMYPNKLIINLFDNIFKMNSQLVDFNTIWQEGHRWYS